MKIDTVRVNNSGEETRKKGQREGTTMAPPIGREKDTTLEMINEMEIFYP